jgi:hypothetical protein
MSRDDLAQLRALAGEKGFDLERATMLDRWRLVDEATGELAKNENGSVAVHRRRSNQAPPQAARPLVVEQPGHSKGMACILA